METGASDEGGQDVGAFASVMVPEARAEAAENYIAARARERIKVDGLSLIFVREHKEGDLVQIIAIPCFDRPVEIGKDGLLKRELKQLSADAADAFKPGSLLREGGADAHLDF